MIHNFFQYVECQNCRIDNDGFLINVQNCEDSANEDLLAGNGELLDDKSDDNMHDVTYEPDKENSDTSNNEDEGSLSGFSEKKLDEMKILQKAQKNHLNLKLN